MNEKYRHSRCESFEIETIAQAFPWLQILYLDAVDSTNNRMRKELLAGKRTPILIVADIQTAGRGQRAHQWWSPKGALLLTLGVRWDDFDLDRTESAEFSKLTAEAVASTVNAFLAESGIEDKAEVAPPNDVFVRGRKIAGILIESPDPDQAMIGIGINVNNITAGSPEMNDGNLHATERTSLTEQTGKQYSLTEVTRRLLEKLLGGTYRSK